MLTALALSLLLVQSADTFEVRETMIADEKAVFATVESINTVPARARIRGTMSPSHCFDIVFGHALAISISNREIELCFDVATSRPLLKFGQFVG